MNVALFFTFDMSLYDWKTLGLIDREVEFYKKVSQLDKDIKFLFVTYGDEKDLNYKENFSSIDILPIYSIVKKPKSKYLKIIQSLFIPFIIRSHFKNIDIFKTNQLYGAWVPLIIKLLTRKPLIIRTGFDLLQFSFKEKKSFVKISIYYLLTQIALLLANLYFVSSKSDSIYLFEKFILLNKSKVIVRPNWIIPDIHPAKQNKNGIKVLTVGRLEKQKNYFKLIEYFGGSDFELDIVGDGTLKNELVNYAEKQSAKVNFLGLIDYNTLLEKYKEYTFFILSSKFEGHPKALIEAMSRGCICIVNKNINTEEIISNFENGILYDANIENPLNLIEKLQKENDSINKISKNAVNFANTKYSIEKEASKEIDFYRKLIKN